MGNFSQTFAVNAMLNLSYNFAIPGNEVAFGDHSKQFEISKKRLEFHSFTFHSN